LASERIANSSFLGKVFSFAALQSGQLSGNFLASGHLSAYVPLPEFTMNSTGNTILVTGSTSGIGLGLALRLHKAGNNVIIAGRRKALLDKIVSQHPGIESVLLDVADPQSIQRSCEALAISHPNLNVLINNAGIMHWEDLTDSQYLSTAEDIVTTNLLGTIRMVYAFTPQLIKQPSATIINVSSALAFVPLPATPTYSATKAAVHSFTQSLRVQLEDSSVEVIELAPPGVRTTLLGQENDEHAMPLDEFLNEIFELLEITPTPRELVVERAKPLRLAEANGDHDEILNMLAGYKAPAE
jgi:short-subunit dehydrogenase involved in D-alanine esterification of teichoic acids